MRTLLLAGAAAVVVTACLPPPPPGSGDPGSTAPTTGAPATTQPPVTDPPVTEPPTAEAGLYRSSPLRSWRTDGVVQTVLVVGQTVIAGGQFSRVISPDGSQVVPRANLAAFRLVDGTLIPGFVADVTGASSPGVFALATDGVRLYVGGQFDAVNGVPRGGLAALDPTSGAVLAGFRADTNGVVAGLAVLGDSVYLGGRFGTVGGANRSNAAAVARDTGAVRAFDPRPGGMVEDVVASPTGDRVYLGGRFRSLGASAQPPVAAVDPQSGAVVAPTFVVPTGGKRLPYAWQLEVAPDGRTLYAAMGAGVNSTLAWDTGTGRRRWQFRVDGDTQAVRIAREVEYSGFHDGVKDPTKPDGTDHTRRVIALDPVNGQPRTEWFPTVNGVKGVWDIDASSSFLVLGGDFSKVSGVSLGGLAIFPA